MPNKKLTAYHIEVLKCLLYLEKNTIIQYYIVSIIHQHII